MTKGEPFLSKEDEKQLSEKYVLVCEICMACLWVVWILGFLEGTFSNQSPFYIWLTFVAALGTIVVACARSIRYMQSRRKLG